jgi:hypothetical protein
VVARVDRLGLHARALTPPFFSRLSSLYVVSFYFLPFFSSTVSRTGQVSEMHILPNLLDISFLGDGKFQGTSYVQ